MSVMKLSNIFMNMLGLSAIALTVACNEEERVVELSTIKAVIELPTTKTTLDGPDANGVYKTVWASGDAIAVCSSDGKTSEFKLKSGENTNKGEFEGAAELGSLIAVYPYSIVKGKSGSTISVSLPEVQEYVSGNIPAGAYPMVASSDNSSFSFKNLCSVLKFRMFGDLTIKSITLTPNDSNIRVSGDAFIDINSKELVVYKDANPSVSLNCPDGVKLTSEPTDFLIVVPAQKYVGGFTITISTNEGIVVKTIKSDMTLNRSTLYPSEVFECKVGDGKDNIVFDDANFKTYIIKNFDTDGDGEISHEEAMAITKIDVDTDNIESLSGIEYMTNLTELNCEGPFVWSGYEPEEGEGKLKTLDVSKNTKLTKLYCGFNQLSSLDLTKNVQLERLRCAGNYLTSLDVSKNTELTRITAYNNRLSSIDVSNNTKLAIIDLSNNQIKSIDVSKNESLTTFNCDDNLLTELYPYNNSKLTTIYCSNNKLSSINVSKNAKLTDLAIYDNNVSEINISNNLELIHLYCDNNKISELDLSKNSKLKEVSVNDNNLTSLTVSSCPEIVFLGADNNQIKDLDISDLVALKYLNCVGNPLATLYVFEGQVDAITEMKIPSSTSIVVKGSEEPGDWADKEFWHKSLGMRFTATWCGYCPTMATSFKTAMANYPDKIELVNLHASSSNLAFSGTSLLASIFNITGYPTGIVDYRTRIGNSDIDYTAKLIVNAAKETENSYPTKTGISFRSSASNGMLNLDIKLYIKEKGDYKVTAILLEDNIIGEQNGAGNDYVHDRIARLAITGITGDEFSTTADFKTVNKHYSAALPSSLDKGNLYILVYVLKQYGSQTVIRTADYGDYYVDNAASAAVGTVQELILWGGNEDITDGGEITLN